MKSIADARTKPRSSWKVADGTTVEHARKILIKIRRQREQTATEFARMVRLRENAIEFDLRLAEAQRLTMDYIRRNDKWARRTT